MTIARKKHYCMLCSGQIKKGENYVCETITPWDNQDNDTFGTYKAHIVCDQMWQNGIGEACDWVFQYAQESWDELRAGYLQQS